jgi:hypothetical protein
VSRRFATDAASSGARRTTPANVSVGVVALDDIIVCVIRHKNIDFDRRVSLVYFVRYKSSTNRKKLLNHKIAIRTYEQMLAVVISTILNKQR